MIRDICKTAALCAALMTWVGPAFAQKAKDMLRFAVTEPFKGLSGYYYSASEAAPFYRQVFDYLIGYNEHEGKFQPGLAKSWTRLSETVLELDLREGIKFHNGSAFDADDVVYTISFAADEKFNFPFKTRYTWVKKVEKLGPYKVRIEAKKTYAYEMMHLAYRAVMLDSELHQRYEDRSEYGRKSPVGTGPYKVVEFDRNDGILVERYDGYAGAGRAPIRRIHGVFIPEQQTQVAELLVGNVDSIRNVSEDNAKALAINPNVDVTAVDSLTISFLQMDAAGRSGKKEMTDPRVRKAMAMAIDRKAIKDHVIPGGEKAKFADALCFKTMLACAYSTVPPAYDPAASRKLLAEAGYPDGFDLEISTHITVKDIAVAIAGDLRKIGIRGSVNTMNTTVMRKKRTSGGFQVYAGYYPNGSLPDVANALDVQFGEENVDYARDPELQDLMKRGLLTHDIGQRTAIYRKVFDLVNERNYFLPIASLPIVYAHGKDVEIKPGVLNANEVHITDFFWK